MRNILFALEVVAPVFLMILLGFVLRRRKMLTEEFVSISSQLVFRISLPAFIFVKLSSTDFLTAFNAEIIGLGIGATLFVFGLAWIVAAFMIEEGRRQGPFIQGVYRSNYGIIGLAVVFNMYGESGLKQAVILLSALMPLFNTLAILALTIPAKRDKSLKAGSILTDILTNPLNIATLCGICASLLGIPLGSIVLKTGNYLAALTIPIALIGIGGSLTYRVLKSSFREAMVASVLKIVAYPLLFSCIAYYLGFRGEDFGVLFILFACPTAIVSFAMARAMANDANLAANIVLLSTVGSVVTLSFGIFLVKLLGLI